MNKERRLEALWTSLALVLSLALVTLGSIAPAMAGSGGPYELAWYTIDGGGDTSMGGSYTLHGTAGQPDPGELVGGGYRLVGGFWAGGFGEYRLYLPVVLRSVS